MLLPLLALLSPMLLATSTVAQTHCSQLPPLTRDGDYPRCTHRELTVIGYPDHMHMHHWSVWETPLAADGQPFGPGSLCKGRVLKAEPPRLVLGEGETRLGRYRLRHHPGYRPCDMIAWLELLEYAEWRLHDLVGLAPSDTLVMRSPNNTAQYMEQSGQGVWRLYLWGDDEVILEPVPVLQSRTLEGHAAHMLMTEWVLGQNIAQPLPAWLRQGLIEYLAENGQHLANYMAEFRPRGPILMSPPLVGAILDGDIDPDEGADRENYRRACYSAFLMVWELVENQGGMPALREFLGQAAGGIDLDRAASSVYGLDMTALATTLDAAQVGEPAKQPVDRHSPHKEP